MYITFSIYNSTHWKTYFKTNAYFAGRILEEANPSDIMPYVKEYTDPTAFQAMRDFREPFAEIHEITFYAILGLIVLHIAAVIRLYLRLPPANKAPG